MDNEDECNMKDNGEDMINNPSHYGGGDNVYEAIKVIEAHNLNFNLGNACKYLLRAGKKDKNREKEDLEKAIWYIKRHIEKL